MTAIATPEVSPTAEPTTATVRLVPTRRLSFDEHLSLLPRRFAGEDSIIQAHLVAVLSAVFRVRTSR